MNVKALIPNALSRIEKFKHTHKKTYWTIFIALCLIAPIEMLGFTILKKAVKLS